MSQSESQSPASPRGSQHLSHSRTFSGPRAESRHYSESSADYGGRKEPLTPRLYIEWTDNHARKKAQHALYPGENFRKLANFLNQAILEGQLHTESSNDPPFATLYLLQVQESTEKDFPSEDLRTPMDLSRVEQEIKGKATGAENLLLFLRGFPSPTWLATIGSHYHLDPEFFRRHLDFSPFPHQQWFSSPSLPSTSRNLVQLRITTLARRRIQYADVHLARQKSRESMATYLQSISEPGLQGSIGDSIVRKFSLHNEQYFSMEQDISMCCCKTGEGWTVIAWLDSGKELTQGPAGPWSKIGFGDDQPPGELEDFGAFELIPSIWNQPGRAIYTSESNTRTKALIVRAKDFGQSRAILNLDYGRQFEELDVFNDAFYSTLPIFKYKAVAESQFLNLVNSVLQKNMEAVRFIEGRSGKVADYEYSVDPRATHANFAFHKELLENHVREIGDNIRAIKARGGPEWPASGHQRVENALGHHRVESALTSLQDDYESLQERGRALSALCDRAMQDIQDKSTLAESLRANEQADKVNKLTRLATFMSVCYVPLSYTSGFFGMNFSTFGQGTVSLWLYAVVAVPILMFSIIFMYWAKIMTWLREQTSTHLLGKEFRAVSRMKLDIERG